MNILGIRLYKKLAKDISIANMIIMKFILDDVNKLSSGERNEILEHYQVKTIYELIHLFKFISDNELRKKFDRYVFNPKDVDDDFEEGMNFNQFRNKLNRMGFRKAELYLHNFEHPIILGIVSKFIIEYSDIISNVELLIPMKDFVKVVGVENKNKFIDTQKLSIKELNIKV